ncbi:MAG: UDP-3-O-(3-hydroxymyristoyl)glucosamine N-acyltransferase [Terrimicrobiaceae bacterium]
MTLREIADLVGGWINPEHEAITVHGVASLADAVAGEISFFGNPRYLRLLRECGATAVLVPHGFGEEVPPIRLWVDNPAAAFALVLEKFAPEPVPYPAGVHPTAIVSPEAKLGEGVHVGPLAVIEAGAVVGSRTVIGAGAYIGHCVILGEDCVIHPRVVLLERSRLGNRVVLHPGVVIGSDGFGYEFSGGVHQKIPQTGVVQIDDDVEIGANTTVDRARFGRTWIKKGTKIDNLCQVAHNVTIGEHCILCAQVGISGSTRLGNYVTLAGKVGVNGHIEIHDGAVITAMAGVTKSVPAKEVLVGIPARPMRDFKENFALLKNIRKLYERVQLLERQNTRE